MHQPNQLPQFTVLTVALAGVLAALAPTVALSADQTITGSSGPITQSAGQSGNITVTNSGTVSSTIAGTHALTNGGTIVTLSNSGTISATSSSRSNNAIDNTGSIGTLNNLGTITSSQGYGINSSGTIGTLTNSGTIQSGNSGIVNSGTIGTLTNSGNISSSNTAIHNTGSGSIGTLSNTGTIQGHGSGVWNDGTIGTLINSGTLLGSIYPVIANYDLTSTISTLINSGTIYGKVTGIYNSGTIGTLSNSGTIQSDTNGIYNDQSGTISTLSNSGLISGNTYALKNTGSAANLSMITNSGTIAGNIINTSASDLLINGGTGAVFGTLTGFGGTIGTITNTSSNVVFGSGNQLLNNNINVGSSHTVSNVAGTLQVNNPLSITGNFSQGAGATLKIGVADNAQVNASTSDTGYGRLLVSGSATLASGSAVTLSKLNSFGFATGQRYLVAQAATTGTNFNAGSLVYTLAGFKLTGQSLVDGSNTNLTDLILTVAGRLGSIATTQGAVASLSGLFKYNGTNSGLMNLNNAAAALDSPAAANRAGAQLSPSANAAGATQAAMAPTAQVLTVAAARMDNMRVAQAGGSGVSTGESANHPAVWGQTFGGQANQNERDGVSGYKAKYSGLVFGSDAMVNDNWRAGGLLSYANTAVDNTGDNAGSLSRLKSYGLFGYAGYTASVWYLDLSAGAVQHKFNTQRAISFNGFSGTANGAHDALQYVFSAQAGRPVKLDALMPNTTVTPIAGLVYSGLRQNSYTETGGNGAALQVGATTSTSIKSDLAVKLERLFATAYGDLVPAVQLGWRHEYKNTRSQSVSSFAADTSGLTSFTSMAPTQKADTAVLGLSMTLMRSKDLTLAVRYTWEGTSGYSAQTADIRVRYQF